MPKKYTETQGMIEKLKAPGRKQAREAFATKHREFLPSLNQIEMQVRSELHAIQEMESIEDHPELINRTERKRGKYTAALKAIEAARMATMRLNKVLKELDPLLDEYVQRAIELAGYDDFVA